MVARAHDPSAFEWAELEALYGEAPFLNLIERALAQLRADLAEFDCMLGARAYASASQRLHRMKGTASFFSCGEKTLAALHCAEKALSLADPEFIELTLPLARRAIEALVQAFEAQLLQAGRLCGLGDL
jgi:hypothetical protein